MGVPLDEIFDAEQDGALLILIKTVKYAQCRLNVKKKFVLWVSLNVTFNTEYDNAGQVSLKYDGHTLRYLKHNVKC